MFGAGQHATVSMASRQVLNRVLFLETTCWVDGGVSPSSAVLNSGKVFSTSSPRRRIFFVASIRLPSCSLRNMISFVHRHVYELFDHLFENLNGFLNAYSRSSRFFVLNFIPFSTLMSTVCGIFSIFSTCHLSNQEHSCLKCVPSTT